ncbi:16063_t:CDS:1, partial [Gigaspora margarita]
ENSNKKNKIQPIFTVDKALVAHEGVKVYILQSITLNQRQALLFNIDEPFKVSMDKFNCKWWLLVTK